MAVRESMNAKNKKHKVFVSWSGENTKQIAGVLKIVLEESIFSNTDLKCFVSKDDIASGEDWWNKIKRELRNCSLGIICVSKENIDAPWIYYEAGAMAAKEVPVVPLLINCDIKTVSNTPLKGKQCVSLNDRNQFAKMICDINNRIGLLDLNNNQLKKIALSAYEEVIEELSDVLKTLKNSTKFNAKYVYPQSIERVLNQSIFISAPMSAIDDDDYVELRSEVLVLRDELAKLGFQHIYSPIINIETRDGFDGKNKAIKENFKLLKQVNCMMIIYPKKVPSSVLVEAGYGLSLSKKTVIFYKDSLPYMLEEAGQNIDHIKTFKYTTYKDIHNMVNKNGGSLFYDGRDDD